MPKSYIYFAGESLACMADTRRLAIQEGLIWRRPSSALPDFAPGTPFLLAYWVGPMASGYFVPLARFVTRLRRPTEIQHSQGPCYCQIPSGVLPRFFQATPGKGGHGYRLPDNKDGVAICVSVVDRLDDYWNSRGETSGGFGFDRGTTGQRAYWIFQTKRLLAPLLPRNLWP